MMDSTIAATNGARRRCWVVCRKFGAISEVWLYRQVQLMRVFQPEVVCWRYENASVYPVGDGCLRKLDYEVAPSERWWRWWIRARNFRSGNFYGTVGREARELRRGLKESRPSVILAQFGHTALRVLPVAINQSCPIVAHFHGVDITASLSNRWYLTSLKNSIPRFSSMIVVADYQRDQLVELGAREDSIHVIPCGVPTGSLRVKSRSSNAPCSFIFVGRFVEKKGPLQVIKAFAEFANDVSGVTLTMVGDGPLAGRARALAAELGILDQVHFLGPQPQEEVLRILSESSVYVQHSLTAANGDKEGWPVSIAEAMVSGLPVVSTRHAGIGSQVHENDSGFLVTEGDWLGMSRRMRQLAEDHRLREQFGIRSRQIAIHSFDQARMVSKLESVLAATCSS